MLCGVEPGDGGISINAQPRLIVIFSENSLEEVAGGVEHVRSWSQAPLSRKEQLELFDVSSLTYTAASELT